MTSNLEIEKLQLEKRKTKALENIAIELRYLRMMKEAEIKEQYSLVWDFS